MSHFKSYLKKINGISAQMTFALCLQLPNHIKFKRPLEIYANFIPQMIFLQSIFGYLVVCILYKWSVDWSQSATSPPSLLNMLISMFLSPGTLGPDTQLYAGQGVVQVVLLGMAAVCVPWLLVVKPWFIWREMNERKREGYIGLSPHEVDVAGRTDADLEGEEEGAVVQDTEEGHVNLFSLLSSGGLRLTDCYAGGT